MMDNNSFDRADELAARAVLLAARTAVGVPTLPESGEAEYIILPRVNTLSLDEAATVLASMPKPLECTASLAANALQLTCRTLSAEWAWFNEVLTNQVKSDEGNFGPIPRMHLPDWEVETILLRGSGPPERLSPQSIQRWYSGYVLTNRYGIAGNEPTNDDTAQGLTWVLQVISTSD